MTSPTQTQMTTTGSKEMVDLVEDDLRDLEIDDEDVNVQDQDGERLQVILHGELLKPYKLWWTALWGGATGALGAVVGISILGGHRATVDSTTAVIMSLGAAAAVLLVTLMSTLTTGRIPETAFLSSHGARTADR